VPVDERAASSTADIERETSAIPERAAPEEMSEHLMESEHRGRYLWAADLAAGLEVIDAGCGTGYGSEILAAAGASRVVGVDISQEAIDYARSSSSQAASEFHVGGLHELPFADATFDMAVCFEVIEHVEEQQRAIGELRRVLKPSGVLAISSPNRDVYPPGNPHHLHEFVPDELEQALTREFANVRLYRQSPWLTAAILDDEQSSSSGIEHELSPRVMKVAAIAPGEEMYTVALASDGELPEAHALALMGKPFELRWWQEQLTAAKESEQRLSEQAAALREVLPRLTEEFQSAAREAATLRQTTASAHENELNSARRLLEVEALLADASARVAALAEAYNAHERQIAQLQERIDRADRVQQAMQRSLSWRVTKPLRALKRRR
jgi:2-polyprenyl-3-methyl-5-hydroxy-6-metoxy-1,4-benzoquinol methylase